MHYKKPIKEQLKRWVFRRLQEPRRRDVMWQFVAETSSCDDGRQPRTTDNKAMMKMLSEDDRYVGRPTAMLNLRHYTAAVQYTYNMAAVTIADRMTSLSSHVFAFLLSSKIHRPWNATDIWDVLVYIEIAKKLKRISVRSTFTGRWNSSTAWPFKYVKAVHVDASICLPTGSLTYAGHE